MRVQVNLSNEMCLIVDKYAKSIGVSRSALCSMFIGQGIMSYENRSSILDNSNKFPSCTENLIALKTE